MVFRNKVEWKIHVSMLLHNGTIIVFLIRNIPLLYKRDVLYLIHATSGSNVFIILHCGKRTKQCAFHIKH